MNATPASSSDPMLQRQRWMKRLGIIFLVLGLVYFIYWILYARFYESTDDAYVAGNLIQVMPQVSGHVIQILADETDIIKKGQPLVLLDRSDAEIALKNAESQLGLTVREISQLYRNVAQETANLTVQKDTMQQTQEDYQRRLGLVVNKTISAEDLSHAKIAANSAAAAFILAKNKLSASIALVQHTDLYHHPAVLKAAELVRENYLALQRTTIYAPDNGSIAKRPVEIGQQVTPNTIMMIIVPLSELWVDANFKESQLKRFRIGQPAELISDLYGNKVKFQGKVIGLSSGTGSAFDLLPPQNATGNWIKIVQRVPVRISIDPQQLERNPLQIGLSMTVSVDTHHEEGAMLTKTPQEKIIYQTENYGDQLKKADELINQILQSNAENVTYPVSE